TAQGRPADGIQPVRRECAVLRVSAACRQRFRWWSTGLDPEVQGLGEEPRRLYLFHHPGPGVGRDLRSDRRADVEDRRGICDAARAAAEAQKDLRTYRAVDYDQEQVRGHGTLQQGRYPRRSDPVDEGNRRG